MPESEKKKAAPVESGKACCIYETQIGKITVASDGDAITTVHFGALDPAELRRSELTDRAAEEIGEYLSGKRTAFDLPVAPEGTAFQKRVWDALQTIPYGETRSYRQIAEQIGSPKASRAVGMANNKNPIAILIPCHRVVGADGSLVGYAAGLEIKKRLLTLEKTDSLPAPATYLRKANYYETDKMGIIHHSNTIRWMEEARIDFLEQIGWGYKKLEDDGLMIPVTEVSCRYKSPVRFGDTVRISVRVSAYQGVRMTIDYRITDLSTGSLRATGRSGHCFCNREGRPIRLKKFSEDFDRLLSGLARAEAD
ncbi:Methylated-DNA--protein-cysteine methyltransferase [Caprobacter fermentans]|uniref:Methylated-DNA--protein-cysteine methyltransferase n=2 Tax=Caproicibacter fermentans TaxID=2576756 RepID=A0A6N8I5S1_9FIRM|nr:Methylated-DNA--protein-cysteine methyltransferase [Caproicibacter fermentans]